MYLMFNVQLKPIKFDQLSEVSCPIGLCNNTDEQANVVWLLAPLQNTDGFQIQYDVVLAHRECKNDLCYTLYLHTAISQDYEDACIDKVVYWLYSTGTEWFSLISVGRMNVLMWSIFLQKGVSNSPLCCPLRFGKQEMAWGEIDKFYKRVFKSRREKNLTKLLLEKRLCFVMGIEHQGQLCVNI